MNQTVRPNSFRSGVTWWRNLGTVVVRNGLVTVRLTALDNTPVAADAIRLERIDTGIFPVKKTAKAARATAAAPAVAFSSVSIPAASPAVPPTAQRSVAADVLTGSADGGLFSTRPLLA